MQYCCTISNYNQKDSNIEEKHFTSVNTLCLNKITFFHIVNGQIWYKTIYTIRTKKNLISFGDHGPVFLIAAEKYSTF